MRWPVAFWAKQTPASGLAGRVYEFTPLAIPPAESSQSCTASTDAMSPDCRCVPGSLRSPATCVSERADTHSASTGGMLPFRRRSFAGSRRNAPAPLDFRAPLAPESCARALDFEIGDESLRIANRGLGSTYRLLSFGKIGIVTHSSSPKRHADRCETWWSSHSYLINQSILTVIVSP
jgi:hypothetical protein